jgi:hypothetical protein
MKKAARLAVRRHELLGESIAVSRDGKVVIVPSEETPDFPEESRPARDRRSGIRCEPDTRHLSRFIVVIDNL